MAAYFPPIAPGYCGQWGEFFTRTREDFSSAQLEIDVELRTSLDVYRARSYCPMHVPDRVKWDVLLELCTKVRIHARDADTAHRVAAKLLSPPDQGRK